MKNLKSLAQLLSFSVTLVACNSNSEQYSLNRAGTDQVAVTVVDRMSAPANQRAGQTHRQVDSEKAILTSVARGPKILIVVAHPDDEYCFAATTYRIAKELGGIIDQVVVTNGEGGYKYSKVAEPVYGVDLTREAVGRASLPEIREKELLAAGKILGIRDHVLIRKPDFGYTTDAETPMERWGKEPVIQVISDALKKENYDFVFTHLPVAGAHGHHKAATSMALEAVARMKGDRPVVLGCYDDTVRNLPSPTLTQSECDKSDQYHQLLSAREITNCDDYNALMGKQEYKTMKGQVKDLAEIMRMKDQAQDIAQSKAFVELADHPETKILEGSPTFAFDRNTKFGFKNRQDYQVYVNWMIAAHTSQGFFQTYFFRDDLEKFRIYNQNPPDAVEKTKALFDQVIPNSL